MVRIAFDLFLALSANLWVGDFTAAAFDAPGAGTQSTGFSKANAGQGETGFEGSHQHQGSKDTSGESHEGGVKGAMHKVKDAFTN